MSLTIRPQPPVLPLPHPLQACPAPRLLSPHPAAEFTQLKTWRDVNLPSGHFRLQRRLSPREGHICSHPHTSLHKPAFYSESRVLPCPCLRHLLVPYRGPLTCSFHADFQQVQLPSHHTQVTRTGLGLGHLTQAEPIGSVQSRKPKSQLLLHAVRFGSSVSHLLKALCPDCGLLGW